MEYRSTNVTGYTHWQGDMVSNVASSHGVQLSGGSTGGVVETASDDANAALTVRAKGTGPLVLGNSSNVLSLPGQITSTAAFMGTQFRVQGASSILLSPTSTAAVTIGNSSNENPIDITGSSVLVTSTHVRFASTRMVVSSGVNFQIGSTAPWQGDFRVAVANCTTFNFSSTDAGKCGETTVTVTGVNSSHFITAHCVTFPAGIQLISAYPVSATAASVHLVWINGTSAAVGNSTANIRFNVTRY